MKKKVIMIIISATMICLASHAQVVVNISSGQVVIDCSVGMPENSYTTWSKPQRAPGTTSQFNGNNDGANLASDVNNKKVYYLFEVSKTDERLTPTQTWIEAIKVCADKGSDWRLPTQRELMLMYVLRPALESQPDFIKFEKRNYWSATNLYYDKVTNYTQLAWGINFDSHNSGKYQIANAYLSKTMWCHIRCIRELRSR